MQREKYGGFRSRSSLYIFDTTTQHKAESTETEPSSLIPSSKARMGALVLLIWATQVCRYLCACLSVCRPVYYVRTCLSIL